MEIVFTKEQIAKRVRELAEQISRDYKGKALTLVGVLRGGAPFLVDLMRELDTALDIEIDFISVGSYGSGRESSGVVTLHKDTTCDCSGRNVILVDDICDSGRTISHLKQLFSERALSCSIAVMLSKPSRRVVDIALEYVGFIIPDKFFIGYGMDDDNKYRNLADICVIE